MIYWLHEATGDKAWLPGFIEQTTVYRNEVPRSPEGAIMHSRGEKRGGGQAILIDALQDYASRMAMLGKVTDDPTAYREAAEQVRIHRELLRDPKTGLWCQGRGWREDRDEFSPGAWSRGHGWLIKGMWHCLLHLPPEQSPAEVSGTALIAANFALALDAGLLEGRQYRNAAWRAFRAVSTYVDQDGSVDSVSPGPGPLRKLSPGR